MSRAVLPRTRRVVAAFWLASVASMAPAQGPNATAAQAAARDWLALTDRGAVQASWAAAGQKFRAALPLAAWDDELQKERAPLGAVASRAIFNTNFRNTFPDAPEGEYALIAYMTSFAGRPQGRETVTLEREADGKWRVIGYDIH
jgi:hypothetical protein